MTGKRIIVSALSVILGALILVGAGAPAQASSGAGGPDGQASVTAVSPSISPGPARPTRWARFSDDYTCEPRGWACFAVNDPTTGGYKIFDLYYCGLYTLRNWYNYGSLRNNQFPGANVILYDQYFRVIGQYPPDNFFKVVNWGPVYYIRPC